MMRDQHEMTASVLRILRQAGQLEGASSSVGLSDGHWHRRERFGFGLMLVSIICFQVAFHAPALFYKATFLAAGIGYLFTGAWFADARSLPAWLDRAGLRIHRFNKVLRSASHGPLQR